MLDLMLDFATSETEERMFLLEGFAGPANLQRGGISTSASLKMENDTL